MTRTSIFNFLFLALFAGMVSSPQAFAAAEKMPKKKLKTEYFLGLQLNALDNADLGTGDEDMRDSISPSARMRATYNFTDNVSGQIDVKAVAIDGDSGSEDETGQISTDQDYLELRQYWLKFDRLGGVDALALQAGRHRVKEKEAFWWNRDIDAVRILYNEDDLKGFIGIAEALSSYRTSDNSFIEKNDDRFHVMGEGSWQWQADHFLELRGLYKDDHSGTGDIGDVIESTDRDDEDFNLGWMGVRSAGKFAPGAGLVKNVDYKFDLIGVAGNEDNITSASGPGSSRTVTGISDEDVQAWGFDGRASFNLDTILNPSVTFGYAYGSGDDDASDGTDNEFRQSGLHSNSAMPGGASNYIYYYGEALRPELANLHILTAGAGVPLSDFGDINFFYHYYHLDENAADMRQSSVSAPLNGTDKSLGQEFDVILNLNVKNALNLSDTWLDNAKLRTSVGVFDAGAAYGAAEDEKSVRGFTELVFYF